MKKKYVLVFVICFLLGLLVVPTILEFIGLPTFDNLLEDWFG
ncbi:MAG TPA: hypothetical protein VK111_09850 [Virgibacillus sp.]|nr:hypothetical protein [Virgibacillus sp.]